MSKKRNVVELEDFLRVVVVERAKFPTKVLAADALGYKGKNEGVPSFMARLKVERQRYPDIFKDVPDYPSEPKGKHTATASEASAILAKLRGAVTEPVANE